MSHAHDHAHAETPQGLPFAIGIGLNTVFVVVEAVYGILAGSIALVADAVHNLSDVLGLALAWGAVVLARRGPTKRRTYGLRKSTILSALANAVLLLVAVGGIAWEAVGRFARPEPVQGATVMIVASIGVLINGVSAFLFARGSKYDLNIRGAFLHLAADAAVSLGVVLAGFVVLRTGWNWLDPATSIVISLVVLVGTWGLLKDSLNLALDAVPEGIDVEQVRAYLLGLPYVENVHDLHVWAMSTTDTALTAHLGTTVDVLPPDFLRDASRTLHERFGIEHTTLQVEPSSTRGDCVLARESSL